MPTSTHLIGAYGLHWRRSEIDWHPGSGRSWQLLGRVGTQRPGLRLCDFRTAAGVYVLERRGRPIYAGLARSGSGIGVRLRQHTDDALKNWNTFSWFSFDDVRMDEARKTKPPFPSGWACLDIRDRLARTEMDGVVGELEALLVNLLYDGRLLVNVQRPRFPHAQEWTQIVRSNFRTPGICHRVDPSRFAKRKWLDR